MDIRTVEFSRAAYKADDFPTDRRPQFAMVGRSNVGKSSVINAVLKRKGIARVSQTPGKTQAIQFYLINERFYIVDFPGYGYAKVPRDIARSWGELVRGYLESADALKLIFILLDVRRTPSPEDRQMHDWTVASGIDERILLTKTDKLSNNQLGKSRAAIAKELEITEDRLITSSVITKTGIEQVRREIASRL
ncbi:MAG TPA: ribosome biogenesis GTP-binding protein YihA/YsxC [Thermoanaerobaculia bacterium]|nr:ribosome biogenesis GTP-binding protein YihA/YsxC [Thermoanaerobaculia bacterium]